jgi:hypothetical protein
MRDDIKEALGQIKNTAIAYAENNYDVEIGFSDEQALKTITNYINELEEEIDYLLDDVVIVSLDIDRGNVA